MDSSRLGKSNMSNSGQNRAINMSVTNFYKLSDEWSHSVNVEMKSNDSTEIFNRFMACLYGVKNSVEKKIPADCLLTTCKRMKKASIMEKPPWRID